MADKELSVEDKAEQIGKDIGVKDEPIPDYDIQPIDETPKEQAVDDDEDKRLGKEREPAEGKKNFKEMSNREKRALRKKRLSEKFDQKDAIIRQQQEQMNALAARLNEVDGKLTGYDKAQLDAALRDTQNVFAQSEKSYMDAFNSGDAAKATQAMRSMYDAQKRVETLQAVAARQQLQLPRQPQQAQNQVDSVTMSKAQAWAAENKWYKADGADEDSAIAQTLAERLVAEGFDPKTDDYWEEFDDRLGQRGVGSHDDEDEQQSQSEQLRQEPVAPKRRSPPVSSGSNRGDISGGKVAITLPTALIQQMKESGAWDDPARKHKIIKDYQRIRAEEQSGGGRR